MNNCIVEPIVKKLHKALKVLKETPRMYEARFLFPPQQTTIVEQVADELCKLNYKVVIRYGVAWENEPTKEDIPNEIRVEF